MDQVRTRFAPSPTGYMHIGNLRTALYAYLLAKKNNGTFILRIEDTDQERYVEGALDVIYKTLSISGLTHDEGPDVGGEYGPYIQSQRKDIYLKHANELVGKGGAYRCFCSKERLDALRLTAEKEKKPYKYDGFCKKLTPEEVGIKIKNNESSVVRQMIPSDIEIVFDDLVYGRIVTNSNELDEGVLLKANGLPTYNFANVVDDHLMEISHIIRGSEYISSTPKFILLYQSFGWDVPAHIHLPLIMKNAHHKFSKREGDASFFDLLDKGYLKDAIINYIALLGWHPKNDQELFSLSELVQAFDVNGLHKASAIFDVTKLNWMNGEYIKKMNGDEFHTLCVPYYEESIHRTDIDRKAVSKLLQARISILSEIPRQIDFFEALPAYDTVLFENKKMKSTKDMSLDVLPVIAETIGGLSEWNEETIKESLSKIIAEKNLKNGQVLWPLRIALSGKEFTPGGAVEIAFILGRDETKKRIQEAIKKLQSSS